VGGSLGDPSACARAPEKAPIAEDVGRGAMITGAFGPSGERSAGLGEARISARARTGGFSRCVVLSRIAPRDGGRGAGAGVPLLGLAAGVAVGHRSARGLRPPRPVRERGAQYRVPRCTPVGRQAWRVGAHTRSLPDARGVCRLRALAGVAPAPRRPRVHGGRDAQGPDPVYG
jgi:hypothetical protein